MYVPLLMWRPDTSLTRCQRDRGKSYYGEEHCSEQVNPHPKLPGGHQIEVPVLGMHIQVLPEVLIGRLLFAKRSDGGEPQMGGG